MLSTCLFKCCHKECTWAIASTALIGVSVEELSVGVFLEKLCYLHAFVGPSKIKKWLIVNINGKKRVETSLLEYINICELLSMRELLSCAFCQTISFRISKSGKSTSFYLTSEKRWNFLTHHWILALCLGNLDYLSKVHSSHLTPRASHLTPHTSPETPAKTWTRKIDFPGTLVVLWRFCCFQQSIWCINSQCGKILICCLKTLKNITLELTRPLPVLWPYIYKRICKIWPKLTWRIPLRNPHRFKDFVGIHSNRHFS